MGKGLLKYKGLIVSSIGVIDSAMTADETIIATTKAAIESAINALPDNMGQYSIFLQYPDGSSAVDYDFDIDVQNKHNGTFIFEAENALSARGINQPVEFIFDSPNKRINFINCNLTVIRDSIKFTGAINGQTVFVDITDSKIEWIDRYCYDNCEACNQETIVLHGVSAVSNDGTFQGSADTSNTIYCSLENELNANEGDQISIINGARNTIPFKYAGAGGGSLIVSGSNSACEEDAATLDIIPLTGHTWDTYTPIPQLNAPSLTLTSIGDSQVTLGITDANTTPNEESSLLQYKLATEPTVWTNGSIAVQDAISVIQPLLTNDVAYDFRLIATGNGTTTSDSMPSNIITATPTLGVGYGDDLVLEITTTTADELVTLTAHDTGVYDALIDWDNNGTDLPIATFDSVNLAHTFAIAGTHIVRISGTSFPRMYINSSADAPKITGLLNWGSVGANDRQTDAYEGCSLQSLPTDVGALTFFNTILRTSDRMFSSNNIAAIPDGYTLAAIYSGGYMFYNNGVISVPSTVTLDIMYYGDAMFDGCTIPTIDYSQLLINIEANNVRTGRSFGGGNSQYDGAAAIAAKEALYARTTPWYIEDGGLVGYDLIEPTNPLLTGVAQVGQTLTASATWQDTYPSANTLYIFRNSVNARIGDSLVGTYVVEAGDVGETIYCQIEAKTVHGIGSIVSTSSTAIVIA